VSCDEPPHDRPPDDRGSPDATTPEPLTLVPAVRRLADWLGLDLSNEQFEALDAFGGWLAGEAERAGGIGPAEVPRLFDRHIGDSLVYLVGVPRGASTIVDVGSGVGLPGIPLAIARPAATVTLVDRSRRRVDLARRAVRILGLGNVDVVEGDVADLRDRWQVAVFRASLPIAGAHATLPAVLESGGTGLFGVSRRADTPDIAELPPIPAAHLLRIAPPMLDSPFWLLRMRSTSG
jgi:16S rRNA G527 N7-methylase RsmG